MSRNALYWVSLILQTSSKVVSLVTENLYLSRQLRFFFSVFGHIMSQR